MPGPRPNAESVTFVPFPVFAGIKMTQIAAVLLKLPLESELRLIFKENHNSNE